MRIVVIGAVDEIIELIKELNDNGHEVIILDDDRSRIDRFAQELDIPIYFFSLPDSRIFTQAGIHKADIILAVHPNDMINIIACVYAKSLAVPKIYAVVNSSHTANILNKLGLVEGILIKSASLSRALTELIYGVKIIELDEKNYLVMATINGENYFEGKKVKELEERGLKILAVLDNENNLINYDSEYVVKKDQKIVFKTEKDKIESLTFRRR